MDIKEIIVTVRCVEGGYNHSIPITKLTDDKYKYDFFKRTLEREKEYVNNLHMTNVSNDYISGALGVLKRLNKKISV